MSVAQATTSETSGLQEQVASEIRAYLARRRISASRAAEALGWSQAYISRRISGVTAFDVADLEALAELLDVPVTAFFDSHDQRKRPLGPGVNNAPCSPLAIRPTRTESPYVLGSITPAVASAVELAA